MRGHGEENQHHRWAPWIGVFRLPHLGTDLCLDAELFAQLAAQALLQRLTGLALAAGELPLVAVRLVRAPLADQHPCALGDDAGADLNGRSHTPIPPRRPRSDRNLTRRNGDPEDARLRTSPSVTPCLRVNLF